MLVEKGKGSRLHLIPANNSGTPLPFPAPKGEIGVIAVTFFYVPVSYKRISWWL